MKKWLALVLCALLCLSAPMALAAEFSADGVFTFTYPDDMELDTESYADESTDTYFWLGMLYNDAYTLDVAAEYVDAYAGVYADHMDEDAYNALVEYELEEYEGYGATLLYNLSSDAGLPFYILRMEDEGVVFYYACTVQNGYVFELDFSMDDGSEPDSGLEKLMGDVIASFQCGNASDAADEWDGDTSGDEDILVER